MTKILSESERTLPPVRLAPWDRVLMWMPISIFILGSVGITFATLRELGFLAAWNSWLKPDKDACSRTLSRIDGAKERFALEHNLKPGDPVKWEDLYKPDGSGYFKELPKEPFGGTYKVNPIGTDPACSLGHRLAVPVPTPFRGCG